MYMRRSPEEEPPAEVQPWVCCTARVSPLCHAQELVCLLQSTSSAQQTWGVRGRAQHVCATTLVKPCDQRLELHMYMHRCARGEMQKARQQAQDTTFAANNCTVHSVDILPNCTLFAMILRLCALTDELGERAIAVGVPL
jgi:hypothetical protein